MVDAAEDEELKTERWQPVLGLEAYEVSSHGRVRRGDRFLKTRIDNNGYVRVSLSMGKKDKYRHTHVHHLMAEAFFGPPPSLQHQVAHWDGVRTHNVIGNLRWATPLEQAADRDRHGHTKGFPGSQHHNARLTDDLVAMIRKRIRNGESGAVIAAEIGISKFTIWDAARGRTWRHVNEPVAGRFRQSIADRPDATI